MVTNLLSTAVRLVFLGVVGEYAGRTYVAVCRKPQAAVRTVLHPASKADAKSDAGFRVEHARFGT